MYPPSSAPTPEISAQITTQESPEPMETDASEYRPGLWLADHVRQVYAYNVEHCTRLKTLAIDPGLRASLTSEASWNAIKADQRSWKIRTYHFAEDPETSTRRLHNRIFHSENVKKIHDQDRIQLEDRSPRHGLSQKQRRPRYSRKMETFLCDPYPLQTKGSMVMALPSTEQVADGKRIALVFDRKLTDSELLADSDKKFKKGPKAKGTLASPRLPDVHLQFMVNNRRKEKLDTDDYLKPMDVKILEKQGCVWKQVVKSTREGEQVVPNPLLREYEPLKVVRKNDLVTRKNDGEYYLSKEMVCRLYQAKTERAEQARAVKGETETDIPWSHYCSAGSDSLQQLVSPLLEPGGQAHFFFEHYNSAHTVGVFLDIRENEVLCYIHETEGGKNIVSRSIRNFLNGKLQELCPNKAVTCFYPEAILQHDFASCGVFALKAMNYFRKHPAAMVSWLEALKTMHDNPGAHGRTDSIKPEDAATAGTQEDKTFCPVRLDLLPPHLLKMAHISHDKMPETLRGQEVHRKNGQETLEQYLKAYERSIVRVDYDPDTKPPPEEQPEEPWKTFNTASVCKRYLYLEEYQDLVRKETGEQPPIPPVKLKRTRFEADEWRIDHDHLAPSWLKTARTEDFTRPPSKITASGNLAEINEWLKTRFCEEITETEWQWLWQLDEKMQAGQTLQEINGTNPTITAWLAFAAGQPLENYKWYLINHWVMQSLSGSLASDQ
ncbi:MAG: hypothetical protein ACR2PT_10900 [Endozoicomonas sp.]